MGLLQEISTKGVLPQFVVGATSEKPIFDIESKLDLITLSGGLVSRLWVEFGESRSRFLWNEDINQEFGYRGPTYKRGVYMTTEDRVLGLLIKYKPLRHNPYFKISAVRLDLKYIEGGNAEIRSEKPAWWPTTFKDFKVFICENLFNLPEQKIPVTEFPVDADFGYLWERERNTVVKSLNELVKTNSS